MRHARRDSCGENDRVAIVVYAGASRPGAAVDARRSQGRDPSARSTSCSAGGSTNGGAGIQLAYDVAAEHFIKGGINRVILATDGDFNVGVTRPRRAVAADRGEGARAASSCRVLGFGTGNLKDATMEKLADKGNGNYAYIDSLSEARKVLVERGRRDAGHDRQGREDPGRVQPAPRSAPTG